MRSSICCAALLVLLLGSVAKAAETEIQYLSGLGKDDPVKWEFKCDRGQNAERWSTIGVPSNWEATGWVFNKSDNLMASSCCRTMQVI